MRTAAITATAAVTATSTTVAAALAARREPKSVDAAFAGLALTIGNFDGIHLGHQALLKKLSGEAHARNLRCTVLTFEPHPRAFFTPHTAPGPILTLRDKISRLFACGVEQIGFLPFNEQLAAMQPVDFVRRVLQEQLQTRYVVVGQDFRFGRGRSGDLQALRQCRPLDGSDWDVEGFEIHTQPELGSIGKEQRVSSSAIRLMLQAGDLAGAQHALGRPYAISGRVIHGAKLGRTLGVPTLNLRVHGHKKRDQNLVARGIFIVRVRGLLADKTQALCGVANMGYRPSVEPPATEMAASQNPPQSQALLEVYCLQWPQELGAEGGYGRLIEVELLARLHDEIHYPDLPSLRLGMERDIDAARAYFGI